MTTTVFPGDLKSSEVLIDDVDVTGFVAVTQVFQEIFTPFWSCQLLFQDTQNLIMTIPIQPGSKIDIAIETDTPKEEAEGPKKFQFYVYKISDKDMQKQDTQSYIVHGISKQFFNNQKTRVQKSFKRTSPKGIVAGLLNAMGAELEDGDDDSAQYDLIVPNWSPVAGIEWINRFAKTPDSGAADFLFFQSDDGKFKFKSVEKMFTDKLDVVLKQVQPNLRQNGKKETEDGFVNVEEYFYPQQHDVMKNYNMGHYANTVMTHDIIGKKIVETVFNYGDDIAEDLANAPFAGELFEQAQKASIVFQPLHRGSRDGTTPQDNHQQWVGSRKTNLMKMEENRMIVKLPGQSSAWKWLGKTLYMELSSQQDDDTTLEYDKYFKGDYLVAAIKHVVTHGRYNLVVELNKKRLDRPYEQA